MHPNEQNSQSSKTSFCYGCKITVIVTNYDEDTKLRYNWHRVLSAVSVSVVAMVSEVLCACQSACMLVCVCAQYTHTHAVTQSVRKHISYGSEMPAPHARYHRDSPGSNKIVTEQRLVKFWQKLNQIEIFFSDFDQGFQSLHKSVIFQKI